MNDTTRKRIALVSEYFFPANNAPSARFKPLAEELSKYFDVAIYTSSISRKHPDNRIKCNLTPFPDNTRSLGFRLFFEVLYSAETFFRLLFSRYDYYYITSPSFFNCIAAFLSCIIFQRKYIIDVRDDYPRVFFDTGLLKPKSHAGRTLLAVEKKLYEKALLVVAATAGLADNIRKVYAGEVFVLRNGFSETIFKHNPDKYPVFTLIFHGNLSSFQGIDTILKLGNMLKNYQDELQILIIGKGSDDYKLKNLPGGVIKYLGPKPHHEVSQIIARAHVGLSLRKSGKISEDAFPVRAYEYIGVCLPILVTPRSEAGKYVEKLHIGYEFDETQVSEMVDKIMQLMNNERLYADIVHKLKASRLLFSRERLSSEFVERLRSKINV